MSAGFLHASSQENGLFNLRHIVLPPGVSANWAYRMCGERDSSDVLVQICESVGVVEESVIDCSAYEVPTTDDHFTVITAHVRSMGRDSVLVINRREERGSLAENSLSAEVLVGLITAAREYRFDLSGTPLVGLVPELANPNERRRLYAEQIPYALLLEPCDRFKEVPLPLDDSWDIQEAIAVEALFGIYLPDRDPKAINCLPVADLSEREKGQGGRIREFLVEVSIDGESEYFVVWPGLPPSAGDDGRRQGKAEEMAKRAAKRKQNPPGEELRLHEFHHPHEHHYYTILAIVDFGRSH